MVERTDGGRRRRRGRDRGVEVVPPGDHVRPAGDDLQPGRRRVPGRRRCSPPATSACWPRSASATRRRRAPGPRRRALHRRRAGRRGPQPLGPARSATRTGRTLLALVPQAGCDAVDLGRVARRRGRHHRRHRARRRPPATRRHERRREHGRLRLREGRARPHRRHAVDAGRHQAGQAAGVRHRRGATAPCRCSGCPATRCRRWCRFELFARPGLRSMMGRRPRDLDRPRVLGGGRRGPAPPAATARSTSPGSSAATGDGRPLPRPVGRAARGPTT